MIKVKSEALSMMGARHSKNDDSVWSDEKEGIYLLADGVSEGGQGKLASEMITQFISEKLTQANATLREKEENLSGAKRLQAMQEIMQHTFLDAQAQWRSLSESNPQFRQSATTCIALWFNGRFAIMGHIGDSRAYLCRAGKVYQLTRDHSGLDELLKMGIPMEKAMKSPLAHSLTRAMGNASSSQPDLLKIEFEAGDTLMLCSDGVYSALSTPQTMGAFIQDLLQNSNVSSWIEKCSKTSGDDSSLIRIAFEEDALPLREAVHSGIQASDRIQLVQKTPLSKYFDYVQQSHIAAICEIERFKAGEPVVVEGDDGDCMYIVAKGSLAIQINGKVLKESKPGDFFGEVALVQRSKRTATAIAKEDSVLLSLLRSDLEEVFKKDPQIETRFYKAMLETVLSRVVDLSAQIARSQ